ncbi:MAG: hypothetical protein NTV51_26895 [Verrucomicrobia bacterium]|nr:hypothetical protein [Verrucomicrobiota bacterium]
MKKPLLPIVCAASLLALALPLAAGPASASMTFSNPARKAAVSPATAPETAPVAKPTASATAAKPARAYKLVTSGPPKNSTTHIVYLDAAPDKSSPAAHAN